MATKDPYQPLHLVDPERARLKFAIFGSGPVSGPDGGNGRFLRGVRGEMLARGHDVKLYPRNREVELEPALHEADVVLVHDATAPELVRRIRLHHASSDGYRLLFYDTHRREATAPPELRRFNLAGFDGVLAGGEAIRQSYLKRGWSGRVWTWHEAADTHAFAPHPGAARNADLAWIGDGQHAGVDQKLGTMMLEPARRLRLSGVVHAELRPWRARLSIQRSGLRYGGPLAEHLVPAVWARHRFTVALPGPPHSPPGIPPTRIFEALACGIPLICAGWEDAEGLFTPGRDYLLARDPREMEAAMRMLRGDRAKAAELAGQGRLTVLSRHTCAHRAEELLRISASLPHVTAETASPLASRDRARLYGFPRKLPQNVVDSEYGSAQEARAR